MRFFNTEGPVERERHYLVPPLERVDLDEILTLIRRRKYFVLHAPRQTGKTTILLALRDLLNSPGHSDFCCVYANLEVGRTTGGDVGRAMQAILGDLAARARRTVGDESLESFWRETLASAGPDRALAEALARWAETSPRPLVLLLDEVDSLTGDPLLSLLSQLRSGYPERPRRFPQSVVLCGLRDVRDYRAPGAAGSPFNIKAKSLRLGDFSAPESRALLGQHTEETGQGFAPEALEAVWEHTQGQPWLVNALAYETCFESETGRDRTRPISGQDVFEARDRIIERRDTHVDQLAVRLAEGRVRQVIEPILSGGDGDQITDDDLEYVRDLGLVARDDPIRIANPIYAEVVPRIMTHRVHRALDQQTAWYVGDHGELQMDRLLAAFQEWFRENSEHWVRRFGQFEAGPQLLLHAFLHRVVNGAGWIAREQALGSGRADLVIRWPNRASGPPGVHVIECKMVRRSLGRSIAEGLRQTAGYMDRCGADSGHLIMFDTDQGKSWREKVFRREEQVEHRRVTIWGM